MIHRLLNHFEEFLIASFMAAATLITFTAVVMRYTTGSGISWAQELTIYLFILFVHLDGEIRRRIWRAHRHSYRR
jgi:TRAP-type C4-dicarboxylate transport system permease small subunit